MVELEYEGFNVITFGKYKIAKGINKIEQNDFIELMLLPNFLYRVNKNIFKVIKKNSSLDYLKTDLEEKIITEKVFVADLVEEIKLIDDVDKLYAMLDTDKRSRVQKALIERIEQIQG